MRVIKGKNDKTILLNEIARKVTEHIMEHGQYLHEKGFGFTQDIALSLATNVMAKIICLVVKEESLPRVSTQILNHIQTMCVEVYESRKKELQNEC